MTSTSLTTASNACVEVPVTVEAPNIEHILAGQLAPSSIAMYKRDVQAYLDYATKHSLPWTDPHTLLAWRDELALLLSDN